jgi:RNA polymerase sigma-70 factor, ECF subfamily
MSEDATQTLTRAAAGDRTAIDALALVIYGELHGLAASCLARERADHTLQPTALVHEAYVRLIDQKTVHINDRTHFFALAAQSMRHVLVDHARRRNSDKRGGKWGRVGIDAGDARSAASTADAVDVLGLHDALVDLEKINSLTVRVVELRFFGGLTVEEIALEEAISVSTVEREWRFARAWLRDRLNGGDTLP